MNLKSKPRIGSGMDCARCIAGCAGQCAAGGGEVTPRNDDVWGSICIAARIINLEEEIEASGQLQAPAALSRYPLTTRMCVPEMVWTWWQREHNLPLLEFKQR